MGYQVPGLNSNSSQRSKGVQNHSNQWNTVSFNLKRATTPLKPAQSGQVAHYFAHPQSTVALIRTPQLTPPIVTPPKHIQNCKQSWRRVASPSD